jgi:hypothetical protein
MCKVRSKEAVLFHVWSMYFSRISIKSSPAVFLMYTCKVRVVNYLEFHRQLNFSFLYRNNKFTANFFNVYLHKYY